MGGRGSASGVGGSASNSRASKTGSGIGTSKTGGGKVTGYSKSNAKLLKASGNKNPVLSAIGGVELGEVSRSSAKIGGKYWSADTNARQINLFGDKSYARVYANPYYGSNSREKKWVMTVVSTSSSGKTKTVHSTASTVDTLIKKANKTVK